MLNRLFMGHEGVCAASQTFFTSRLSLSSSKQMWIQWSKWLVPSKEYVKLCNLLTLIIGTAFEFGATSICDGICLSAIHKNHPSPPLFSEGCEGIGTFEFVIESNLIFPWSARCPLMATPEFTALEQRGRKFKIRFGPAALDWAATIIQMSLHPRHHQNHHYHTCIKHHALSPPKWSTWGRQCYPPTSITNITTTAIDSISTSIITIDITGCPFKWLAITKSIH